MVASRSTSRSGTRLTQRAILPTGAQRSLDDPYADKAAARLRTRIYIVLVLLAVAAIWVRYDHSQRGHYFWKKARRPPPRRDAPGSGSGCSGSRPCWLSQLRPRRFKGAWSQAPFFCARFRGSDRRD
jgi:hypothetical protein